MGDSTETLLSAAKRQFFSLHKTTRGDARGVEVRFVVLDSMVGRDRTKSAGLVPLPTRAELVELYRLLFDDHSAVQLELPLAHGWSDEQAIEALWTREKKQVGKEGAEEQGKEQENKKEEEEEEEEEDPVVVVIRVHGSRFDSSSLPSTQSLRAELDGLAPLHQWPQGALEELCMRLYKGEVELEIKHGRAVLSEYAVRLKVFNQAGLMLSPAGNGDGELLQSRYGRGEDVTAVAVRLIGELFCDLDCSEFLNADFEPLGYENPISAHRESDEFPGMLVRVVTQTFCCKLPQLPDVEFDTPLPGHRSTRVSRWEWAADGSARKSSMAAPAQPPPEELRAPEPQLERVPTVVQRQREEQGMAYVPPPTKPDERSLSQWLQQFGVNVDLYGRGGAKSMRQLVREIRIGECSLTLERGDDGVLQPLRVVKVAKIMIRHPKERDLLLVETHQLQNDSMRVPFQTVSEKFLPHEHTWDAVLRGLAEELLEPIRLGYVAMAPEVEAAWEGELGELAGLVSNTPKLPPLHLRRPSLTPSEPESPSVPMALPTAQRAPGGGARRMRCAEERSAVDSSLMKHAPRRLVRMPVPEIEYNVSPSYPGLRSKYCLHACEIEVPGLPGGSFRTMEGVRTVHFMSWLNPAEITRMNASLRARVEFYLRVQATVDTGGDKGEKEALERYMVEAVRLNDVDTLELVLNSWSQLNQKMTERRLRSGVATTNSGVADDQWQLQLNKSARRAAMSSMMLSMASPLQTRDSHGSLVLKVAAARGPACRDVGALLIRLHLAELGVFGTRVPDWKNPRVDLNAPTVADITLLDCAARLDHVPLVELLMMAGARADTVCFHCLCEHGCLAAMRVLLPALPAAAGRSRTSTTHTWCGHPMHSRGEDQGYLVGLLEHAGDFGPDYVAAVLQQCSPTSPTCARFFPMVSMSTESLAAARYPLHAALMCGREDAVLGVLSVAGSSASADALLHECTPEGIALHELALRRDHQRVVACPEFQAWVRRRWWGAGWLRCLALLPPALLLSPLLLTQGARERAARAMPGLATARFQVLLLLVSDLLLLLLLAALADGDKWLVGVVALAWAAGEARWPLAATVAVALVSGWSEPYAAAALLAGGHLVTRFALVVPGLWVARRVAPALAPYAVVLATSAVAVGGGVRHLSLCSSDFEFWGAYGEDAVVLVAALLLGPLVAAVLLAAASAEWARQHEAGHREFHVAVAKASIRPGEPAAPVVLPLFRRLLSTPASGSGSAVAPDLEEARARRKAVEEYFGLQPAKQAGAFSSWALRDGAARPRTGVRDSSTPQ